MNTREIIGKAVGRYGAASQVDKTVEECAELINALQKWKHGRCAEQDVITEIADVHIMCLQMERVFGEERTRGEIERKLRRLEERMEAQA